MFLGRKLRQKKRDYIAVISFKVAEARLERTTFGL